MSWSIAPTANLPDDADAWAYIQAVEAADGQALEAGVRTAINTFVKGCKADGIWPAIKASCILAGARTLAGALVPLRGAAPTNFNFVSGDYNRKTGLVGNGSTKYLDSNRNNNADPQDNTSISVYISTLGSVTALGGGSAASTKMIQGDSGAGMLFRVNNGGPGDSRAAASGRFYGASRSASGSFVARNVTNATVSTASLASPANNIAIFARNNSGNIEQYSTHRLAFYSIGESLDLALLDARVTTLVNTLASVIP